MNTIEELAEKIAYDSDIDLDQKFGSVLIVIMLIGIFVNIIRVIQECDKKELSYANSQQQAVICTSSIKNLSLKRSWYTKMKLKKILRSHMPLKDYRQYGAVLCDKILDAGERITINQVSSLIEANNV